MFSYRRTSALRGGRSAARALSMVAALMLLAIASPDRVRAAEPDEPDAPTAALDYESVLEGYEHIEIVTKPTDWRAANDLAGELDGPRGQLLPPGSKPERRKSQ